MRTNQTHCPPAQRKPKIIALLSVHPLLHLLISGYSLRTDSTSTFFPRVCVCVCRMHCPFHSHSTFQSFCSRNVTFLFNDKYCSTLIDLYAASVTDSNIPKSCTWLKCWDSMVFLAFKHHRYRKYGKRLVLIFLIIFLPVSFPLSRWTFNHHTIWLAHWFSHLSVFVRVGFVFLLHIIFNLVKLCGYFS